MVVSSHARRTSSRPRHRRVERRRSAARAGRKGIAVEINARAGQAAAPADLINVPRLVTAYFAERPDVRLAEQRVSFGTSGHRGSAFACAFNEWHILAITQAICQYRAQQGIEGPLFLGIDTHALSEPACASALEVLAGNGVEVRIAAPGEYTPTPAVSHAILCWNRGRRDALADGIVVTPSHNPPDDGGFKYNPPHGGPAGKEATSWIEARANEMLAAGLSGVRRIPLAQALRAATTRRHDFLGSYVADLGSVIDFEVVRGSRLKLGVDPLGGAGVRYWRAIAERYGLDLTIVSEEVDPTFRFMSLDWDGRIRMDPSSPCDTDHDRHGVVTRGAGLLPPNHYLAVCAHYLLDNRPQWPAAAGIGKTVVSSSIIDRVTAKHGRHLYEVPVGFKWFVDGLLDGALGFVGEESAGSAFLRRDGTPWTTDKDGIIAALLAAEITARLGRDPGEIYDELTRELGAPLYGRLEAAANREQKATLAALSAADVEAADLAGEPVERILTAAPGDGSPIGGVKVMAANSWFAARPSGTEEIYKIYAESFRGDAHLRQVEAEAQAIVSRVLARRSPAAAAAPGGPIAPSAPSVART
jgi:phosphoglucomutase